MKRFHFPLERVRRWRSEQASAGRTKTAAAAGGTGAAGVRQKRDPNEAAQSAQQVLAQPSIDALELTSLESYRQHLRRRIYELENLERQCEAKVAEQRQRYSKRGGSSSCWTGCTTKPGKSGWPKAIRNKNNSRPNCF